MAAREMLMVFACDITADSRRRRVAALIEDAATRVQHSVYEARMTHARAQALTARIRPELGPGDSLRVYAVTDDGLARSIAIGGAPLAEAQDFWLL